MLLIMVITFKGKYNYKLGLTQCDKKREKRKLMDRWFQVLGQHQFRDTDNPKYTVAKESTAHQSSDGEAFQGTEPWSVFRDICWAMFGIALQVQLKLLEMFYRCLVIKY